MVDVARRLCEDNQIHVSEIWSYHAIGDQVRFTLVHRSREVAGVSARKQAAAPAVDATPHPDIAAGPSRPRRAARESLPRSRRGRRNADSPLQGEAWPS